MQMIVAKVGRKYVRISENGKVSLTTDATKAIAWPIDMEEQIEEGLEILKDMGMNVKLHLMLGGNGNGLQEKD